MASFDPLAPERLSARPLIMAFVRVRAICLSPPHRLGCANQSKDKSDESSMESALESTSLTRPRASALGTRLRLVSNSLFALAALCGVSGVVVAFRSAGGSPGLAVQAAVIDLGEVARGDRVPLNFKLFNRMNRPIRILGAEEP